MIDDRLSTLRTEMDVPWDAARSNRVFAAAVRTRHVRARRQRWTMVACAASAALFLVALRSFGATSKLASTPSSQLGPSIEPAASAPDTAGPFAMSSEALSDAGRETD